MMVPPDDIFLLHLITHHCSAQNSGIFFHTWGPNMLLLVSVAGSSDILHYTRAALSGSAFLLPSSTQPECGVRIGPPPLTLSFGDPYSIWTSLPIGTIVLAISQSYMSWNSMVSLVRCSWFAYSPCKNKQQQIKPWRCESQYRIQFCGLWISKSQQDGVVNLIMRKL